MMSAEAVLPAIVRDKPAKEWLSRKEAATYLTRRGCPITAQTLANMGSNNNARGGPPFTRLAWSRVQYHITDLDAWVKGRSKRIG